MASPRPLGSTPGAWLMSVAGVCATAGHISAHTTIHTPAIHAVLVFVFSMRRILACRGAPRHVFLTDGPDAMPNWTDRPASAVGHRGRPLGQKLARSNADHGRMKP